MLTSIDVKLIFNCLFLFSSANILQIADVVRRVTFLLVLAMFLAVKRVKCSAGYVLTAKITQPRAQVFSVNCLVSGNDTIELMSFFAYCKILPNSQSPG